ncbi:hypothetical protein ACS0TY_011226 [Phlomoides rotata]
MTFTCKQPELGKTILSLYVVALISILTTSSNPLQPVQTSRDVLQEGGLPDYPTLFSCESHARARNCIERSFGILKARWGILRSNSYYLIKTQNRFILGCCLLHNFIRIHMVVDPCEDDVPEPLEDKIYSVELGDGFIDQVESSQAWTTMRDNLVMVLTFVEECEMMCALKKLVVRGNQCDNGFKSGYLLILENTLATKFPGTGLKIV